MARHHLINGVQVPFTAEEETARDAAEAAYAEGKFDRMMNRLRRDRTGELKKTDWMANSDVTMSEEWQTYRQALRDLPSGLSTVDDVKNVTWPTKP
jgi:hypothetical protein